MVKKKKNPFGRKALPSDGDLKECEQQRVLYTPENSSPKRNIQGHKSLLNQQYEKTANNGGGLWGMAEGAYNQQSKSDKVCAIHL